MRLDLHVHTVVSDGSWTPEEVVDGAIAGRLDVIAIADHDTTAGIPAAVDAVGGRNLQIVPAAELSSTWEGRELHILGYFIAPDAPALERYQARAKQLRLDRMEGIVERLASQGVHVEMSSVLEMAGPRRSMIGRPHLARAMVAAGYVDTVSEAFDRYIGDAHPAFLPTRLADPAEAIHVIREAGGIAVWAHPPGDLVDVLLAELKAAGLRGLEVYRPRSPQHQVHRLEAAARTAGLLKSGGSDWHDPDRNDPLGSFYVTPDDVAGLLDAGGL